MKLRIRIAALLSGALVAGCTIELQHGLSEQDANEMYVLLSESGISVRKHKDPESGNEPQYIIEVAKQDAPVAYRLLRENSLPRPRAEGFAAIRKSQGMLPTQVQERASLLEALSGEVSNLLNSVDGVLEARAIVMIPERNDLAQPEQKPAPSASVFIKYRPMVEGRPPLDENQVRQMVARAVEDLKPESVAVIMSMSQPVSAAINANQKWQDVLGLRMTSASANQFKLMVVVTSLVILVLAALTTWSFVRGGGGRMMAARGRSSMMMEDE